jgi:hypothetical protein
VHGFDQQMNGVADFEVEIAHRFGGDDGSHFAGSDDFKFNERHYLVAFDGGDFCGDVVSGAVFHNGWSVRECGRGFGLNTTLRVLFRVFWSTQFEMPDREEFAANRRDRDACKKVKHLCATNCSLSGQITVGR